LLEIKAAALFASIPCEGVPESAATHYAQIKAAQQALASDQAARNVEGVRGIKDAESLSEHV
jgi:hypothetical protein